MTKNLDFFLFLVWTKKTQKIINTVSNAWREAEQLTNHHPLCLETDRRPFPALMYGRPCSHACSHDAREEQGSQQAMDVTWPSSFSRAPPWHDALLRPLVLQTIFFSSFAFFFGGRDSFLLFAGSIGTRHKVTHTHKATGTTQASLGLSMARWAVTCKGLVTWWRRPRTSMNSDGPTCYAGPTDVPRDGPKHGLACWVRTDVRFLFLFWWLWRIGNTPFHFTALPRKAAQPRNWGRKRSPQAPLGRERSARFGDGQGRRTLGRFGAGRRLRPRHVHLQGMLACLLRLLWLPGQLPLARRRSC